MITPLSFAVHVTYTCPLSCAHCCFSSSPRNRDRLPVDHILRTLEHLDRDTIKLVAFTGGEPFLLGDKLVEVVGKAHELGFTTRVVTSAFWAKTEQSAQRRLAKLLSVGLNELSISWDDFHEQFVAFACVYNAFWAAKEMGITVAVNTVQGENPKWTAARVRAELNVDSSSVHVFCEAPLNLTGRAKSELQGAGFKKGRQLGPCPYVLTGPTLSAKNKLLACCGVIPDTEQLVLDADFRPENLDAAIEKGLKSPLLNWIHLRGPYAVMAWISKRYGVPIPTESEVGGNCEACHHLFSTKGISERIEDAVGEKLLEIEGELCLLESLALDRPTEILKLWYTASERLSEA
jgi:hypothetical protein